MLSFLSVVVESVGDSALLDLALPAPSVLDV